ncbi:hypothetical protein AGMMS4957_14790 [Bacteroidia bacterium]|nr:hypothetical protein AGMMS4957_14790 [Bacteroidia bacterium]
MGIPSVGDIILVPFPFSDLTGFKKRPGLVLARTSSEDLIICQITSKALRDESAITLSDDDFATGELPHQSNVRPNKIFTADNKIVLATIAKVTDDFVAKTISETVRILRAQK